MEKSNLSDDELIELIKQNDNEAFNMLLFRYRNLITIVCFSYVKSAKMCGIDITELKSIACICIYKNLKYYVKEKSSIKTLFFPKNTNNIKNYSYICSQITKRCNLNERYHQ